MKFLFFSMLTASLGLTALPGSNSESLPSFLSNTDTIPAILPGNFTDDYGIRYNISDTLWLQQPDARYEILRWNLEDKYLIARNGKNNPSDQGLYTRIDYITLDNMQPWSWAFCLTTFNAKTDSLAEFGPNKTDRANPRKGCNGFPFSRMKKVE